MTPIYAVHFFLTPNIGDQIASPLNHVNLGRPVRFVEFRDWDGRGDVIFGGGGILHPGADEHLKRFCKPNGYKRIIWSIGTNYERKDVYHPEWMRGFDLVSVRDTGSWPECVPGPSCLHREFDMPRPGPSHEVVVYSHGGNSIPIEGVPVMSNYQHPNDMWKVLDFLASGDVVITNSYHGSYWAALLGCKVLNWKPNSNRMLFTPWKMGFCDENDWREKVKTARRDDVFTLEVAREKNRRFYDKVWDLLCSPK